MGDIEKVFLNVGVDWRDRDCLCLLWLEYPAHMLVEQEDHWPAEKLIGPTNESHEEERSTAALAILCDTSQGIENVMEISNYSTI